MKNYKNRNSSDLSRVGNYTKNAVESFEEKIVKVHNYLEETKNNK